MEIKLILRQINAFTYLAKCNEVHITSSNKGGVIVIISKNINVEILIQYSTMSTHLKNNRTGINY